MYEAAFDSAPDIDDFLAIRPPRAEPVLKSRK
jgi:hypothetical protein